MLCLSVAMLSFFGILTCVERLGDNCQILAVRSDNCQIGQLSDRTTVSADNCQWGQLSVETTVSGDNCQWPNCQWKL